MNIPARSPRRIWARLLRKSNPVRFSVTLDGVSRQMCYDYLACLAQNGFQSKFPGQENDVSGGWLYSNGNAVVTVSQSGSRMIIGITFESID